MLAHIYNLLYNNFFANPIVTLVILLITFCSLILLLLYCILLFLDGTYRPNTLQYPYNIFLDRLLPMAAILSPTIAVIILNPDNASLLEKFIYIIFIHVLLLVPLMHYWSNHRHWNHEKKKINTWSNPKIYLDITIAIIYPAVLGVLILCFRYLRWGNKVIITYEFFIQLMVFMVICILLWPYASIWLRLIVWNFLDLKQFLWAKFSTLIYSITILLLKYKLFFKLLEKIYQLSFLWISFVIHHPAIYDRKSRGFIKLLMHHIYLRPLYIYLPIIFFGVLEHFLTGFLQKTLMLGALLLIIKPFISFLNSFNGPTNDWVQLCCEANYINYDWINAYYPYNFWISFYDLREKYNNMPLLDKKQEKQIKIIIANWLNKENYCSAKNFYIYTQICTKSRGTLFHKMRLTYYRWTNINIINNHVA